MLKYHISSKLTQENMRKLFKSLRSIRVLLRTKAYAHTHTGNTPEWPEMTRNFVDYRSYNNPIIVR